MFLFNSLLVRKRESLEKKALVRELALAWQPLDTDFVKEKDHFDRINQSLSLVSQSLAGSEEELIKLEKELAKLNKDKLKQDEGIISSQEMIATLKPNVEIVGLIIQLTEGITQLGEAIRDKDAEAKIETLYGQYHKLSKVYSWLLEKLKDIPNAEDYVSNQQNINKQLAANLEQLQVLARGLIKNNWSLFNRLRRYCRKNLQRMRGQAAPGNPKRCLSAYPKHRPYYLISMCCLETCWNCRKQKKRLLRKLRP